VLGSTGRFGAIAELLLSRGHAVRAGSRDPRSSRVRRLGELGAEVVAVDFDDVPSLKAAASNVDAVFASGTAHRAGPEGEARHGINLAEALAAAGKPHLVFVSGAGADRSTGVPVLEAKRAVEQHIAALGLPVTLLAPAYLMENLFNPWNLDGLRHGRLLTPIPPGAPLQQVPVEDILALAVHALEHPDSLLGARIELASDEPTGHGMAAAVSGALVVSVAPAELPRAMLPPGLIALFDWLARDARRIDLATLRESVPAVRWHPFDDWVARQRRRLAGLVGRTPLHVHDL
jgi:uncharacterized protein YbjT (DUF2867 family)